MSTSGFFEVPALDLWQKARFALGTLYTCQKDKDWHTLEGTLATEWLTRVFGVKTTRKCGGPRCSSATSELAVSRLRLHSSGRLLQHTQPGQEQQPTGAPRICGRWLSHRIHSPCQRYRGDRHSVQLVWWNALLQMTAGWSWRQNTGQGVLIVSSRRSRPNLLHDDRCLYELPPETQLGYLSWNRVRGSSAEAQELSPYYVTNLASEDFPFTGRYDQLDLR